MSRLPIEGYALLGDLETAALVGWDGSLDWLCMPAFDSPACFAALLGDHDNGRWRIAPAGATEGARASSRQYRGDTMIVETRWVTDTGAVEVVDFMPPRGDHPDVVRIVRGVHGTVAMELDLRVRFDYGNIVPWVQRRDGRWTATAGPDSVYLDTPVSLVGKDRHTTARFDVHTGESVPFVLTWAPSYGQAPTPVKAPQALEETENFWAEWVDGCSYDGEYAEPVRRSLLLLKALTHEPTGGIAAAATTSLPELLGGSRNWDYRFCWLRDTAFTLQALAGAGFTREARAWRDWLLRAVAGDPADLQIMYSLTGRRRLPEQRLGWLSGYEGSAPVRIGNAAAGQFQLDVYGELLDGLHTARSAGLAAEDDAWALQRSLTCYLETVWSQPDNSLWEIRGPQRQFVHSKVMAWVAFDRMVRTAEHSGLEAPVGRWRAARHDIRTEVCAQGYDQERGTFTQFYGSKGVDAALLLLPRMQFLPLDDPRILGTIDAVQRELVEDGLVLRYRPDADPHGEHGTVDGLPGGEGAFIACSYWLADALALTGRSQQARDLFERLLDLRNDVGMLSEEWDPHQHRQLGNVPQAYSHVGLVNTALALARTSTRLATGHDSRS